MNNNLFLYQVREDLVIDLNKITYIQKQYYEGKEKEFTGYYSIKLLNTTYFQITEEEYKKLQKILNESWYIYNE